MKRIGALIVAVLAAAAMGKLFHRADVGKLQPVRAVYIRHEEGQVTVSADTGETGAGPDVQAAFEALKQTASAEVFLDTADFVLFDENSGDLLPEVYEILRPGARVCLTEGEVDPEATGKYLAVHRPEVTLAQCRAGEKEIPVLRVRGGRMELVGETDQS